MSLPLLIGAFFLSFTGFVFLQKRSLVGNLLGFLLLSHAVNLSIFTSHPRYPGKPPLIPDGETLLSPPFSEPLPQALLLTALVIGLALTVFLIVLSQGIDAEGEESEDSAALEEES